MQLLLIFFSVLFCLTVEGATTSSSSTTPTTTSPTLVPPKAEITPTKQPPKQQVAKPEVAPVPQSASVIFSAPGIATFQDGQWVGSEDLLNIPKEIGIYVEINKPTTLSLPLSERAIQSEAETLLSGVRLKPRSAYSLYKGTPLPFLHILIMVTQVERGLAVYCAARLFEEVKVDRVQLKPGIIWQAITWEKQELVLLPLELVQKEVQQVVHRLVQSFVDRYSKEEKG